MCIEEYCRVLYIRHHAFRSGILFGAESLETYVVDSVYRHIVSIIDVSVAVEVGSIVFEIAEMNHILRAAGACHFLAFCQRVAVFVHIQHVLIVYIAAHHHVRGHVVGSPCLARKANIQAAVGSVQSLCLNLTLFIAVASGVGKCFMLVFTLPEIELVGVAVVCEILRRELLRRGKIFR